MTSYVSNGLIAYFNPNNASSYSGSGATLNSLVGSGITGTLGGTYSYSSGTIRLTNSPPFTLTALNQTTRQWAEMTTLGNDVYASVWGGDIYKQTGGTGNFVPLNQVSRNWFGMTTRGNDVYATDFDGDIYKQTNATGNFAALGQTQRSWRGMTTLGNDVYACVQYNGDIYKQTNGTGNFAPLNQGNRQWFDMTTRGTDIYACVYDGDIYKQTNGTGNFVALNQTTRGWHGLTTLGNDVYACVFGGDIYVQYGGTGNFIALGQVSGSYTQMTTLGNKIYISVQNGDIYTFNPSSKLDITSLSNVRTISIWMYLHSANDTPWRYLVDARTGASNGYIANKETGSDWSGSTYYLNNGDVYDLTAANIQNFLSATGQWVNITVVSNSSFTDDITLFGRYLGYEGLDCSFGPIMIYNRVLSRAEQVQNFYASEHNYLRIRSKAINTYSSNGLIAYFNPNNSASYSGSGSAMTSLAGSGVTGTLGGTYSYSNGIIRIVNNTGAQITNNSRLQVSTLNNVRSISMWIYIHSSSDSLYRILFDGYRWGEPLVLMNRENISDYFQNTFFYVNNGNVYAMNDVNRYSLFSSTGVWMYATFISNTPYTGGLTLFAEALLQSGLDCSFGPIMMYNRVLTRAEHIQNFYATEFNYLRSQISYQHPNIALTADSSNGYVASASSTQNSSAFQAFKAFDLQTLDYDGSAHNFWHSTNTGNNYNSSSGVYLGSTSTTVSGVAVLGEWIQLQLPQSIVLSSFIITPRRDDVYDSRAPTDFVIAGSNNGSTWTQVYSTSGITWGSELPRDFAVSGTPSSYSYYRLITRVVGNSGTSNRISVIITEWSLYTSTVSNINTPLYQHPFLAMTTDSSVGYVASSSGSHNNNSFPAFQATNLQTTYSDATGSRFWHSLKTYNSTTGIYTGGVNTTVNGSSVSGEWLQLQLPYRLILRSFTIAPRNDTPSDIGSRGPNDFIVAGSNDGSTWTQVYTTGGMITWVGTDTRTFTITNSNIGFSYYRLITKVVGNASTVVSGSVVRDSVIIPEWNLFGTETALLSLTTPTSSNLPLIAGGMRSNATNTLAYGRPGFVSFSRTNSQHLYTPSDNTIVGGAGGAQVQKSTPFNISTNGGFTAVCLVRFTGTAGENQRVFDFGNGSSSDNILLAHSTSGAVYFTIFNGNSNSGANAQTANSTISQDIWYLFACRYTKSTNVLQVYLNGSKVAEATGVTTRNDRSLTSNYIGRSNWSDPYVNMDLAGLIVYDRSLSDAEITTCSNILYGSVATTSVPATPVYRLLVHDLMNLNASQPVSSWGVFIQATAGNRPTYSDVIQWTGLGKSILPECQAVAFNPKPGQNRWIAGGAVSLESDTNSLVYSNDGVNWTGLGKSVIYNVIGAFTNGSVWIITGDAVNGATTNSIAVSTDNGLTWSGKGRSILSVCWEAAWNPKNGTSGRWVAGGSGANSLAYSDDNGTTWTAVPNSTNISNTVFCIQSAVLSDGSTLWVLGCEAGSNSMAWSLDGLTWTGLGMSVFSSWCYDIQYNGIIWVAVGSGNTNVVATSFDGKTWTGRGKIMDRIREVCWTGTYWVASGEPGASQPSLAYSTDGITWTSVSNSTTLLQNGGAIGSRSFNLLKQTLTFNDITKTVGDAAFTPSVSTDAVPSYSSYTFSVPAGNGVATTNGSTITIVGGGSVIITATQASDGFYEAATATALLTVINIRSNQTLTFSDFTAIFGRADFTPTISTNASPSYSSYTFTVPASNGVAQIVSNQIRLIGAGSVIITATQAANSLYNQATATATMTVVNPTVIAGGSNGTLLCSADGTSWTSLSTAMTGEIQSIGYNPSTGRWVAVGSTSNNTQTMMYSDSNGTSWTNITNSQNLFVNCYGVDFFNSVWVATGDSSVSGNSVAVSSNDGVSWTGKGSLLDVSYEATWNPRNGTNSNSGRWVAVGHKNSTNGPSMITSDDNGTTWRTVVNSRTEVSNEVYCIRSITTSDGSATTVLWVAGGNSTGNNTLAWSSDGWSWTGVGKTILSDYCRDVQWNGSLWVAVGSGTSHIIATSSDGKTWTGRGKPAGMTVVREITWSGTYWIITGEGTNALAYSTDGINWTGVSDSSTLLTLGRSVGTKNLTKFQQTLTFSNVTKSANTTFTPTVSTDAIPSYSSYTFSVPVGNGFATTNGSTVTTITNGTTTITATQAENSTYTSTAKSATLTVGISGSLQSSNIPSELSIISNDTSYTYGTSSGSYAGANVVDLSTLVSSASFEPYTFSIQNFNPSGCASISGNTLTFSQAGTVNIQVTQSAGGGFQAGGPLYFNVELKRTSQLITFGALSDKLVGDASFNLTATSSSGLTINYTSSDATVASISGNAVTILKGGSITITAAQNGNGFFNAASSVIQNLIIYTTSPIFTLACGQDNRSNTNSDSLCYSTNGINWVGLGKTIFSTQCNGAAYNGSLFVAVGSGTSHSIATSPDGINWTGRGNTIFSTQGNTVAWNGSLFVAVGSGTSHSIATSPDGINWTGRGNTIFSTQGNTVAWNGIQWVAGGSGTNTLAYSSNGIDWTGVGSSIISDNTSGVIWNRNKWVAVGRGTNTIATSPDGITWTGLGSSIFSTVGNKVATNGTMFVAVGQGTNSIAYSSDGINWTGLGTSIIGTNGNAVAWNGSLWLAGSAPGSGGTVTMAHSIDAINWTVQPRSPFANGNVTSVATNGSRLVAGATGSSLNNSLAYSDDNGTSWTGLGSGLFKVLRLKYGNSIFMALNLNNQSNMFTRSNDGINWTALGNGGSTYNFTSVHDVAWNGSRMIVVGGNNSDYNIAYSDNNGDTWTFVQAFVQNGRGISYSPSLSRWVAVGQGTTNTIMYSDDNGITWTGLGSSIFSTRGHKVSWSSSLSRWVAVGLGTNTIAYSDNGINWTGLGSSIMTTPYGGNDIAWNGSRWLVVGFGTNALAYSNDGINWTVNNTLPYMNSTGLVSEVNSNFVIGQYSNIVYSSNGVDWTGSQFSQFYDRSNGFVPRAYIAPSRSLATITAANINTSYVSGGSVSLSTLSNPTSASTGTYSYSVLSGSSYATLAANGTSLNLLGTTPTGNPVQVRITQDADDNYAINTKDITITINKASPTISGATAKSFTYGTVATGYNGTTSVDLTALGITSDSNGTLSYTEYADTENCGTVSNNTLVFSKAGTITIRVNQTEGNFHNALSELTTFTVNLSRGTQILTFDDFSKTILDSNFTPTVTTNANPSYNSYSFSVSSNNGVVNLDGETISIVGLGSTTITVTQAQNDFYYQATDTATITITKANQTISNFYSPNFSIMVAGQSAISQPLIYWTENGGNTLTGIDQNVLGTCNAIVYSGSKWIIVGRKVSEGFANMISSTDGFTWSSISTNLSANECFDIAFNGTMFIAVGQGGSRIISGDSTGTNWSGLDTGIYADTFSTGRGVAWNGSLWIVVGEGTNHSIASSTDGINWNRQGKSALLIGRGVASNSSMWVAVGGDFSSSSQNVIVYSTNGTNWNVAKTGTIPMRSVVWQNNIWLVGGDDGIWYSLNGINWTQYSEVPIRKVFWSGSRWFAGSASAVLSGLTSTDGKTWVQDYTGLRYRGIANKFNTSIGQTIGLSATVSSGLTPSFISAKSSVGTINGSNLTIAGGGFATLTASQSGNDNYNSATSINNFLTVYPGAINYTTGAQAPGYPYQNNKSLVNLADVITTDGTVSFSGSSSYASIDQQGAGILTFSRAGESVDVSVTHYETGQTLTFAVTLNKGTATINASNITTTYTLNGTIDLAALSSLSSDSTGSFSYSILSGGSYATITSGSTLRLDSTTPSGTPVQIRITQASDDFYLENTKDITVTILNIQTVSFSSATNTFNETSIGATFALSGRATSATSSSNPIQYSLVNNSGVAIISGSNIVIQGGGVFTLRASQPAFENYGVSNTAEQTITVYLSQNVEFGSILSFGSDLVGSTISLSGLATSSTNTTNPIQYELVDTPSNIATISNDSLQIVGSGVITLRAYQNAGGYYNETTTYNLNQWNYLGDSITSVSSDYTGTYVIRGYTTSSPLVEYSIDKGDTWSTLNIPYVSGEGDGDSTVRGVYSNSSGNVLTVVTENRIYISRDSGSTWSSYTPGGISGWQKAITNGNGTKIIAMRNTNDYIYYSLDSGTSWNAIASIQEWTDICVNSDFTVFAACSLLNVYVSLNGGIDWIETTPSNTPNRWYRRIACSSSGARIYVTSSIGGSLNGNILYSANYGQTWKTKGINTTWYGISCDASGTIVIAGDYTLQGNLWTSFDGGDNWIVRSLEVNNASVRRFTEMHCSGNGKVFFGTSFTSAKLYRSFNNSRTIIPDRSQQVLSFTLPPTISYGTVTTLSASSTSGLSDFLFSSFNPNIATVVLPRNLSRSVSPTLVPQGVGSVTVSSYQDGNETYLPTSTTASTTIIKGTPTISGATAKTFTYGISATGYNGTTTVDLTALGITSTSNGLLSYTEYADTQICGTVSNNILTFSKAGTITIRVNQESTSLYTDLSSLSVTFTVQLLKTNPTISGATTKNFSDTTTNVDLTTVGVSSDSSGTLSYTEFADPDNIGTVSNNILTISKVGTITIQVNQTAGNFHDALSSIVTFDVVFAAPLLRSRLNLWDESRTKRFRIQHTSSNTTLVLNENKLNITDGDRPVIDIVSLLTKVQPIHNQINSLEVSQTVPAEDYSRSLVSRASVLENNIFSQSSLIARAQDSIISLSTRASVYEDNVASQASLIVRAQDSMTSLSSRAGIHEENVASQASLIIRARDSIASLSTRAGIYEKDVASQSSIILKSLDSIVSLSSRAHLYEENIASQASLTIRALDSMTSLSSRAGIYEENIASQGSIVSRSLDSMTSLSSRAGLYEENIASQGSLATRAHNSLSSLSTRAGLYEENIFSQGSLATRAHNSITSLSARAGLYEENIFSQGSLAIRALDSMISLSTRASVYEDNVASQASLAIRAQDSIISLSTRAGVYEENIFSQGSLATRALNSLSSLSTRAGIYEENIFSQGSLAIRAQDSIISLSTRAGVYEDNVASQASLAIKALDSVSSLSSRASLHENGIASQGSLAIRALDSLTSLTTRFSNIGVNIFEEASKMTNVETNLSFAKDALYTIFDGNPNDANYSTLQLITTTINANPNIFSVEQIQSRLDYITSVIERLTDNEE